MKLYWAISLSLVILALFVAEVSASTTDFLEANALTNNALTSNALTSNALTNNALTSNALTSNALTSNALSAYSLGTNTIIGVGWNSSTYLYYGNNVTYDYVLFLHYLVLCALPPNETVTLVLTNGTQIQFVGAINLAPLITEQNLTAVEMNWVYGCLLATVNAFGVHVHISMRSGNEIAIGANEAATYSVYEGSFFGDPVLKQNFTCQGESLEEAESQSAERSLRVCTDNTSNCDITVAGKCSNICLYYTEQTGYTQCTVENTTFSQIINIYLKKDKPSSSAISACYNYLVGLLSLATLIVVIV